MGAVKTRALSPIVLAAMFASAGSLAAAAEGGPAFEWDPGPRLQFMEGKYTIQLRGLVQGDYVYVDGGDGAVDASGVDLRRARLALEGEMWQRVEYEIEADFADNGVVVTDAFIMFDVIDFLSIRIGQFETPNSLSERSPAEFITFMERPQFTEAFNLDRRLGVGARLHGDSWLGEVGVFFQNIHTDDGAVPRRGTFGAVAARGHYAIEFGNTDNNGSNWLHLGTSVRYRSCDNDADSASACGGGEVHYRERPFFRTAGARTLDTETIEDMQSDIFWGPEIGIFYGPFAFKSEAGLLWGNRSSASGGNFGPLWGAYADVGYFLTGERQAYSKEWGELDRPRVSNPVFEGGWGAWEIAARFDYLSLNDDGNQINGGRQWIVVAGVNWWLSQRIKLQANYAHAQVRGGPLSTNGSYGVDGFGLRAQVDW
jgi:phosphate-selective porin OprO and OprP